MCNPIERLVPFDHTRENVGILVLTHPNCKCKPTPPDDGEYVVKGTFFYDGINYTIVRKNKGMFGKKGIPEITCSTTGARIDTMLRISPDYPVLCDNLEKEFRKLVRGQNLPPPTPRSARSSSRRSAASAPAPKSSRPSIRHAASLLFDDVIPTFGSARSREQPVKPPPRSNT